MILELAAIALVLSAATAPKRQPALGWFLARDSVDFMHQALCREKHREVVQRVRKELGVTGGGIPLLEVNHPAWPT